MNDFLQNHFSKISLKVILLTMIVSFFLGISLFYFHTSGQREMLKTEIGSRSVAIGNSVAGLLNSAIELGIPFDELVGASKFLNDTIKNTPDVDYIAITDTKGDLLYKSDKFVNSSKGILKRFALSYSGDKKKSVQFEMLDFYNTALVVKSDKVVHGFLHLGVSKKVTNDRINDVYYDILTILFVSMIACFEFFTFIFKNTIQKPIEYMAQTMLRIINNDYHMSSCAYRKGITTGIMEKLNAIIEGICSQYHSLVHRKEELISKSKDDDGDFIYLNENFSEFKKKVNLPEGAKPIKDVEEPILGNLRLPAFLMVFAETVLVAILPSYASRFFNPEWGFPKEFIAGSPILVFMFFSVFGVLFSSRISEKLGFRKSISLGIMISAVGHLIAFITNELSFLLITRAITAFGYGISYVGLQNYIATYSKDNDKMQSYAIFIVSFGAAYICGAPIGGILVDNIGYNFTFLVAALTAIVSALFVRRFIIDSTDAALKEVRETLQKPIMLLKHRALMFLVVFAGLPARFMFSALICLFYPLYLKHIGLSQSSVGRTLMIFGMCAFFLSRYSVKLIEKFHINTNFVLCSCGILSGIAIILPVYVERFFIIEFTLALYSISAVLFSCSIMAALEDIAKQEFLNHQKKEILSCYFIAERVGMILGPITVSVLLYKMGFDKTMVALSAFVTLSTCIYAANYFLCKNKRLANIGSVR